MNWVQGSMLKGFLRGLGTCHTFHNWVTKFSVFACLQLYPWPLEGWQTLAHHYSWYITSCGPLVGVIGVQFPAFAYDIRILPFSSLCWNLHPNICKICCFMPNYEPGHIIYLYSSEHSPLETVFSLVLYCIWVMHQPTHIRRLSHFLVGFLWLEFFCCSSEHCTLKFVFPLCPSTQKYTYLLYQSFQLLFVYPKNHTSGWQLHNLDW